MLIDADGTADDHRRWSLAISEFLKQRCFEA